MTPRGRSLVAAFGLFVLVVGLYAPSVRYGFIYDDPVLFAETPVRRTLDGYLALFREPHFSYLPYYRPLVRATFELQKLLHGPRPGLFHLFNAWAAGALALTAWRCLRLRVFRAREPFAWLGAALFALQPVVSSSVYPVAGRETLLAATFVLLAVLGFLQRRPLGLAGSTLGFALALLCHEQAIVLPALLLLVDLADGGLPRGPGVGRRVARYVPFALVAGLYLVARARILVGAPPAELALGDAPLGPALSVGYALTSIFAPTPGLVYEAPLEAWASPLRLTLAGASALAFGLLVWRRRRATAPVPLMCAAWFVLALLPSGNVFVQETRFAERWLCLASFAPVAALAATASAGSGRALRAWTLGLVLLAIVAGAFSVRRGPDHADNRTFLTGWVRTNPRSAQARSSLGTLLYAEGEVEVAELHLRKAVELSPTYADAHASLGALLLLTDRVDEALPHLRLAVRLNGAQPAYRFNLGSALARSGELDAAQRQLTRALQLAPSYTPARRALDEVLRLQAERETGARPDRPRR